MGARRVILHPGSLGKLTRDKAFENIRSNLYKVLEIINKKYSKKLSDEKSRRRSIAALQRLGYRWDDIKAALNQFENED